MFVFLPNGTLGKEKGREENLVTARSLDKKEEEEWQRGVGQGQGNRGPLKSPLPLVNQMIVKVQIQYRANKQGIHTLCHNS